MAFIHSGLPIGIAAHRGYSSAYPENTLPAIIAAVDAGVLTIEVDIQFSKDGVPLLLHDDNFKHVANIDTKVYETNIAEIMKIAFSEKQHYSDQFADVHCCTLDCFVQYLQQHPEVQVFIEIKPESIDYFGQEFVVQKIRNSLSSVVKQCVIISYSVPFLMAVRKQLNMPIGYIMAYWDQQHLKDAYSLEAEFVICNHTKIPKNTNYSEFSWQWLLYEVSNCEQLNHFIEQGVQWVESKDPVKLLGCLWSKGNVVSNVT